MCIKANEGKADRTVRIVLGVVAAAILLFAKGISAWAMWVIGIVGAIALLTGIIGHCGLYDLLKINTLGKKSSKRKAKRR